MTRWLCVSLGALALMAVSAGATAAAATEPLVSVAAAVPEAIPRGVRSVGLVVAGEATPVAAVHTRDAVAAALRAAGYRVTLIGAADGQATTLPGREEVIDLCQALRLDVVVVVKMLTVLDDGPVTYQVRDDSGELRAFRQAAGAAPPFSPGAPPPPAEAPVVSRPGVGAASGADFYLAVGRPDLAARYRERQGVKRGVQVAGGVALGLGVIWGLLDLAVVTTARATTLIPCVLSEIASGSSDGAARPARDPICDAEPSAVPWVVSSVGAGMLVIPAFVPSDPVSDAERRQLARHHDGLRAQAAPFVTAQGGGLMISGRF
jgi:hypothetical protein